MTNNSDANYFKIGSFVLIGIGLIVFALLIFGSGKLFQPVIYVETYFEESVQGVTEGTPVKYRGLQIGYIDKISFTNEIYEPDVKMRNRSIYVKIAITSKSFTQFSTSQFKSLLSKEVEHGLRIKLVAQGLTGTSYLELDYVDPNTAPPYAITWNPYYFYIPSVVSTLTRLSENAQYVMNELKDINFKRIFQNIDSLAISLSQVASKTDDLLTQINTPMEITIQNLRMLSEQLKLNPSSMIFGKAPPPLDPSKL